MLTEESTAILCEVLSNMENRLLTSFICYGLQKTSIDKTNCRSKGDAVFILHNQMEMLQLEFYDRGNAFEWGR